VGVAILRTLVDDTSNGLVDDYEQWFNGPHRLLAFRVPPHHIYIAATFPVAPGEAIRDEWKTEAVMRATYQPKHGSTSAQVQWLLDAMCGTLGDAHWARMQESDVLFAEARHDVLYLGDSAHGMAPTLGQGATQAIEDASCAALLLEAAVRAGKLSPRDWLGQVAAAREARIRFTMQLSIDATDTMLAGADPVAGAHWKTEAPFLTDLSHLFRDVPLPEENP
jgi:salicylate hydroxylase